MPKAKQAPKPRQGSFMLMPISNLTFPDGTWIEGEEFAYPKNTFTRRGFVDCEDGQRRLVKCKVADTFFSIPARCKIDGKTVKGYIKCDEQGAEFIQTTQQ